MKWHDNIWRKTKPTTLLGVGSPSDPSNYSRSHLGSGSGPPATAENAGNEEQLEMITAKHEKCDGKCPLTE